MMSDKLYSDIYQKEQKKDQVLFSTIDRAIKEFESKKRLLPNDQRQAAINLGLLAAKLNKEKPLDGVRDIVEESGLDGIREKRKRFFRLPKEESPHSSKNGTYNANPRTYIQLAKAAGRLLSHSNDQKIRADEEKRALHDLLRETTFLPGYVPQTAANRSLKALFQEYASRLAEALEKRTRLVELWQVLEDTPIEVDGNSEPMATSLYGSSADFPPQLVSDVFRQDIKYAQFTPSSHDFMGWAEPHLKLGYVLLPYKIRAIKIPKYISNEIDPKKYIKIRNKWLDDIKYFEDEIISNKYKKEAVVCIIHSVRLRISKEANNNISIKIELGGEEFGFSDSQIMIIDQENLPFYKENEVFLEIFINNINDNYNKKYSRVAYIAKTPKNIEKMNEDDLFDYEYDNGDICKIVKSIEINGEYDEFLFEDILIDNSFIDNEHFESYQLLYNTSGWVDDPDIAKLIFGYETAMFVPVLENAAALPGPAVKGSIAASILENIKSAPPENQISEMLIQKAALTADAGLQFHDAMLEHYRHKIANI